MKMETRANVTEVKPQVVGSKPVFKKSSTEPVRVKKEFRKKLISDLLRINRKGERKISMTAYLEKAVSLLTEDHVTELREKTLTNRDRLDRKYRDFVSKFGPMSEDEFIGKLLEQTGATL